MGRNEAFLLGGILTIIVAASVAFMIRISKQKQNHIIVAAEATEAAAVK